MWVAAELGARLYVVHPDMQRRARGWNPKVAASLERAFEELSALQHEIGLSIAVENMPFHKHSHFIAPGDLDLRGLGLALDAGHAAVTGTLSDWLSDPQVDLRHVHLHDNLGQASDDHHHPLGTGVIDIEPVLQAARAAGASIVLEHKDEASVLVSLDHLRSRGLLVRDLG
jgi:sugar phosphate isomerase/epimerase